MTLKQWTLNQVQASSLHVEGHCHTKISLSYKVCDIYRFLEAGAYKLTLHVRMHLWFNPTCPGPSWLIQVHIIAGVALMFQITPTGWSIGDPEEAAVVQRANIEVLGSDK